MYCMRRTDQWRRAVLPSPIEEADVVRLPISVIGAPAAHRGNGNINGQQVDESESCGVAVVVR